MKKVTQLFILLALICLTDFAHAQSDKFKLTIKFPDVKEADVLILKIANGISKSDTFKIIDGRGSWVIEGRDTVEASVRVFCKELSFENPVGSTVYPHFNIMIVPGEKCDLEARIALKKPSVVKFASGDAVCKDYSRLYYDVVEPIMSDYNQIVINNIIAQGDIRDHNDYYDKLRKSVLSETVRFIRNNPKSYISLYNFGNNYNAFDEDEMENILNGMSSNFRNGKVGRYVASKLEYGKPYRVGAVAPDFFRESLDGKEVRLSDYKGKYVLLDFWGSWCGPCRASHPHLKELCKIYSPKGLVMVGIAQESERDLGKAKVIWKKAVMEDGLTWTQVLNNDDIANNISRSYNVSSYPTKILISPEGKILARFVGGSADVEKKLKEIFK